MKRYMIDFRQNMERPDNAPTTPFKEPGPPLKPFPKLGAVAGVYDSSHTTISAGVAIFHLASSRVVLCRHSVQGFWFLPKGRRDAGEESRMGAEREGYEESGYRNRIIPIVSRHLQPLPHNPALLKPPSSFTLKPNQPLLTVEPSVISVEPIFTELVPLRPNSQYILYWYVAETVPPEVEESLNAMVEDRSSADEGLPFFPPPPFDEGMTLEERIKLDVLEDGSMYEPIRHPNTGVDDEEALYESYLLPIEEGAQKVRGTILEHVIRRGWQAICDRHEHEIKVGKQEM